MAATSRPAMTRRQFNQASFAVLTSTMLGQRTSAQDRRALPPTRTITHGPQHHWFGYYDKWQFDPTNRFVLGMQVDFEHRSPTADDVIRIGMVDLEDNDRWIQLGTSRAWCWQQGCMLQWLPGSDSKVIWNDRQRDRFVARVLNVQTRERQTIPYPVYSVSPDGQSAVTPDFRRINDVRPGYGYVGPPDPWAHDLAPRESGIFHINLASGKAQQILSLADVAQLGEIPNQHPDVKHYFNHLLYNPVGSRFIALHRWKYPDGSRLTRMLTADPAGRDLRLVISNGYASHFIWRDPQHILAQSRSLLGVDQWSNFLFQDRDDGGAIEKVGYGILDDVGHISYLPGQEWILNDTYPQGEHRLQTPHLFHVSTGRRVDIGQFHLPESYRGEWRVDTHPRCSRNGRLICVDAPVDGEGRQMHLIDVSEIVG